MQSVRQRSDAPVRLTSRDVTLHVVQQGISGQGLSGRDGREDLGKDFPPIVMQGVTLSAASLFSRLPKLYRVFEMLC
jgi:hypothetical protein